MFDPDHDAWIMDQEVQVFTSAARALVHSLEQRRVTQEELDTLEKCLQDLLETIRKIRRRPAA